MERPVLILGIETSCDETAAAVVRDGRDVLSNIVASQIDLHALYGGVVPEIAARAHVEKIAVIIRQALDAAQITLDDVAAVAVTYAPGLIGALMTGVEAAKGLALVTGKPLIAIHHVRAHLYSPFLRVPSSEFRVPSCELQVPSSERQVPSSEFRVPGSVGDGSSQSAIAPYQSSIVNRQSSIANSQSAIEWEYPYIGLAISGGHTSLALVESPLQMTQIGRTRDDAAGEAFDKVAKLLHLGYPGGPIIDRLAAQGDPTRFALPRPMIHSDDLDFSFSGLKTAVRLLIEEQMRARKTEDESGLGTRNAELGTRNSELGTRNSELGTRNSELGTRNSELGTRNSELDEPFVRDLCAGFQAAAIDVLLDKARRAAKKYRVSRIAIVGGVACNRGLRREASRLERAGLRVIMPSPVFCGDNAAMIAGLGYHLLQAGRQADLSLTPRATQGI
ncbi:MAG: tRNA (adenosine(37)-N6)-threonylcarbamoyltransferase complex transferase subunit TsaD [Candidatus Sumerlaeota bacterium]|nr:tRNA (adenosine(37)-N6)-threonylcarbamoyltransferase complex transferase subunit TsaD [Candidatus Sumerlaeota bacterium]